MLCKRAWNHDEVMEIGDPVRSVTARNGDRIHLHKVTQTYGPYNGRPGGSYERLYLRYVSHLSKYGDGREDVEVCEPIHHRGPWPGPRKVRCHGHDGPPRGYFAGHHVWDDRSDGVPPGHHLCGVCGNPAWIEVHGMADGSCAYCGHGG